MNPMETKPRQLPMTPERRQRQREREKLTEGMTFNLARLIEAEKQD